MFNQLELTNIKSFRSATIPLGNFTVLLGTNASGKSNIRDVFRFLHGIGRGYRLIDILAEKYEGGDRVWSGIRGGPAEFRFASSSWSEITASFGGLAESLYSISLQPNGGPSQITIRDENLRVDGEHLNRTNIEGRHGHKALANIALYMMPRTSVASTEDLFADEPMLSRILVADNSPRFSKEPRIELPEQLKAGAFSVKERLSGVRFLDLHPDTMRLPSYPGQNTLGDRGENLSSALKYVVEDLNKRLEVVEWLKALTPMDVVDVEFASDLNGRRLLYLIENDGRKTSATSASDGTLRFLAYIALLFSDDNPSTCFIEEIENGIHPARLNLLVELIELQSANQGIQVIATTHSPTLLGLLGEKSLHEALLVYRSDTTQSSRVRALHDLPRFDEIARKRSPGYLMETSWMENTVSALEYDQAGAGDLP